MELKILQLERAGKKPPLPKYQTEDAAAMDIAAFLPEEGEITLQPGEWKLIPTGLCMAIPKHYGGFLLGRSGLAAKFGVSRGILHKSRLLFFGILPPRLGVFYILHLGFLVEPPKV